MTPLEERQLEENRRISEQNLKMHQQTKSSSHKALNNIIFLTSTGTLVLSISFIGNIDAALTHPKLLVGSWICFLLAIAGNYLSHQLVIWQARQQQWLLNQWRARGCIDAPDFYKQVDNDLLLSKLVRYWKWVDIFVIIFLVAGTTFLTIFGSANLLSQNAIRQNDDSFKKALQERLWQQSDRIDSLLRKYEQE